MTAPIRLLILGTGNMAVTHATAFAAMDGVEIVAAVDPTADALAAFAGKFEVPHTFTALDQAIAWGGFDAAANVTPDKVHYPTTMALIKAGKHVLCEKPLATNHPHAVEMTDAAEARGLVNMVNLTFRCTAVAVKARELVLAGTIGDLRHFDASYLQSWLVGNQWDDWRTEERWLWRLSRAHGSQGVVGDIGVHIIDLTTFVTGQDIVRLQSRTATFPKVEGERVGEYGLDANDAFTLAAEVSSGALGVIHATRWASGHTNDLSIALYGDRGGLRLHSTGRESTLQMCAGEDGHTQTWRAVDCPPQPSHYQRFITAIGSTKAGSPSFREAAKVQKVLDICLEAGDSGSPVVDLS